MKTAILAIVTEQMTPVIASLIATIQLLNSTVGDAEQDLGLIWITDPHARNQNLAGGYFELVNGLYPGLTRYELQLSEINFQNTQSDLLSYRQLQPFDRLVLCAQGGRKTDVLSVYSAMRNFGVATAHSYLESAPVRLRYEETRADNTVSFSLYSCDHLKWRIPTVEHLGERRGLIAKLQAAADAERAPAKRESREFELCVERRLVKWAGSLPDPQQSVIAHIGGGLEWKQDSRSGAIVTDWDAYIQLMDGSILLFECKRYSLRKSDSLRKNVDGKYLSAAANALQRVATSQSRLFVVLGITDDPFTQATGKQFDQTWREICNHFSLYPRVTLLPIFLEAQGAAWAEAKQLPTFESTLDGILTTYASSPSIQR